MSKNIEFSSSVRSVLVIGGLFGIAESNLVVKLNLVGGGLLIVVDGFGRLIGDDLVVGGDGLGKIGPLLSKLVELVGQVSELSLPCGFLIGFPGSISGSSGSDLGFEGGEECDDLDNDIRGWVGGGDLSKGLDEWSECFEFAREVSHLDENISFS